MPAGILVGLSAAECPDEQVARPQPIGVQPQGESGRAAQRHGVDDHSHARQAGIGNPPGHPAATITRFDGRVFVKPLSGAVADDRRREPAQNVGLDDQPHERPVASQDDPFQVWLAIERAVIEQRAISAHDFAAFGRISQLSIAAILTVDHLPRLAPGGLFGAYRR
jgi:hypothetical protein